MEFPSRIGVGDSDGVPCRFVAADMAFRPAEQFPHVPLPAPVSVVSGRRDEDGTVYLDVTFDRDALTRWARSMNEAFRAFGEQMRVTAEATAGAMRPLGEWIEQNRAAIEQAAAEDARRHAIARTAVDLIGDADRDWPAQGNVCAHVCGPDPGHVCDARAVTHLTHPLPSGGTRTLPLCGPCHAAETGDTVRDNPGTGNRETADRTGRA